jgi:hypothetical protein
LSSFIETLEDEVDEEHHHDEATRNAVETTLDAPNYAASTKTPAAEHWKTAIESKLQRLCDNRTLIVVDKPTE